VRVGGHSNRAPNQDVAGEAPFYLVDVAKLVPERAAAVRKLLPETNIAVDLIRESRDDI